VKKAHAFELTPTQTNLLEAQDFERRAPGTLLRDFEALLNLIGDQGMPVTPAHLFAMNCLEAINRNLTYPLELRLKRAMQKSYPHINGLYLLLRASGIGLIDTQSKKPRLKLDPIVLESWRSFNGAERYFALLKAWWGRASEEMMGERWVGGVDVLAKNIYFFEHLPKTGILTVETPQDADRLRYYPGLYNLALMELFGLLEIRAMPPAEGKGWLPEWMRMTDWGKALLGGYADFINKSLAPQAESAILMLGFTELVEPLECFAQWSRVVRPHIKGWQKDLDIPAPLFQPGPHVFKVSLGADCWRRIALRGESHLDELAATILDAFGFDQDHLYRFSYKDRFGRTIEIDHPYLAGDSDNALADDVKVGDIPLSKGMHIGFLFDFGDQWEFDIQTESVDFGRATKKPQVLEKHGKAPKQYGGW
jgi:Plasmid pRiA4b ORF-3-like protein